MNKEGRKTKEKGKKKERQKENGKENTEEKNQKRRKEGKMINRYLTVAHSCVQKFGLERHHSKHEAQSQWSKHWNKSPQWFVCLNNNDSALATILQ